MERIAVIILNYFGSQLTETCIRSVLRELDALIFLIDNSANDDEAAKLVACFDNNPDVALLFPETNLGFAAGVNLGLKAATEKGFKTFLLLNNDAVLLEKSGASIKEAIENNGASLISPVIQWDNETCDFNYYHRYFGLIVKQRPASNSFGWFPYLTGCALIIPAEVLDKNGYFDDSFFMYGEDVEFCHRAIRKGIKYSIIPRTLVRHNSGVSSSKTSFFYEYHMNRAHFLLTFRINPTFFGKTSASIMKLVVLSVRALYRCIKNKKLTPIAGLLLSPFKLHVRPANR